MQAISMRGLLLRSLKHKPGRIAAAVLGLTVSAAIATAMLTLSLDITEKLHHEFRSFGANVVVTTADKTEFPEDALAKVQSAAGSDAVATPFAYAVMKTDRGTDVVVAGTDFGAVKKLDSWWQVGAWPTAANDSLLGDKAAQFIEDKSNVKLSYDGRSMLLHGAGQLKTGGEEESRIYVSLGTLESFAHVMPSVIEVRVGGDAAAVEASAERMRASLPGMTVTPVRQLVDSESRIVNRMRTLLLASVVLIALTVGVAVLATMSASVLERRRDFALMHALGSRRNQILALFVSEAMVIAVVGVVGGYLLGSFAAWGIGELNFHTATMPRVGVLPVVLVMNLLIAFVAAMLPARALRALQPAALLRGE
jgi:putative ABC transport system permease protein